MSQPNQNNNNNHDHKFTKIFVGGLAWKTTTDDLRRFFQGFGEVLDANVVSETFQGGITKSKGYGFVTFRDAKAAARACELPYPVIGGRQTNINLAYIRAKNSQPNQNGLLHQPGPSHQYQNGWINQVAPHQYQLYHHYTNPHFPQAYWYPTYGQYYHMYTVPHYPYRTTMISPYVSTYGMQQNWHQTNIRQPVRISPPPHIEIQTEDISEINEADVVHNDDNNEEAGKQSDNGIEVTPQIVIYLQEEADQNTSQENGVDHGENDKYTSQVIWIEEEEEEGQGQQYMK